MKIVLMNTSDIRGGAARAAYRLHEGLRQTGGTSSMVVKEKSSQDTTVLQVGLYPSPLEISDSYYLSLIQQQYINAHRTDISSTFFSFPYPGHDLSLLQVVQEADIINLHWVAYFQSPITLAKLFSLGKPVVWTLHDQWPFTGGCHYSAGCERYRTGCLPCPQLAEDPFDLPAAILNDKLGLFNNANLTIVTPSKWLASCARDSALFRDCRVEVIPNGLDTDVFCQIPKPEAKAILGIAPDSMTLLFGAENGSEKRKGFHELMAAIHHCLAQDDFRKLVAEHRITLLCFGLPSDEIKALGLPVVSLGYLDRDEDVRMAYSASDVFALPSLEDNLPNTMLESLSCGTPVVAFDVGGIPDVIQHGITGLLAPAYDTQKLGEAILALVFNPAKRGAMGQKGRERMIEAYSLETQAHQYLSLFEDLLGIKSQIFSKGSVDKPDRVGSQHITSPEKSVLLGTTLGPRLLEIYDKVLYKALKEFAPAIQKKWQESEANRLANLEDIKTLSMKLQTSEANRLANLEDIKTLSMKLQTSEANRLANLEDIKTLSMKLQTSEANRLANLEEIKTLTMKLETREELIERQAIEIEAVRRTLELMKQSRSWRMTAPFRFILKELTHLYSSVKRFPQR